jgi:hypothetical protein
MFFDIIFKAVIDLIFGFGNERKVGIFGEVVAHYAVIESQGKGTLHAHMLIWLTNGMIVLCFLFTIILIHEYRDESYRVIGRSAR